MTALVGKEIFDKLKKLDLIKFIQEKYSVKFTFSNNVATACCPHPDHNDHHPSFAVWNNNGKYSWCCFSCHSGKKNNDPNHKVYGSDILDFIRWMSDFKGSSHIYTISEAIKIAADFFHLQLDFKKDNIKIIDKLRITKSICFGCHKWLLNLKGTAYSYLINRGLTEDDIKLWEIGFNGIRITFPFKNLRQEYIGFTSRIIPEYKDKDLKKNNKYLNSPNSEIFNKSFYLYGMDKIDNTKNYLIITEGQFDVIMGYKYGLKNIVATSCAHFSDKHAELIKSFFPNIDHIIFIYDGDEAGQNGLKVSADIARNHGFMVNYFNLDNGQDLCDYMVKNKESGAQFIMTNNIPYFYKEVEKEKQELNNIILNFQSKITPNILNILEKTKNPNERYLAEMYFKNSFFLKEDLTIRGDKYVKSG